MYCDQYADQNQSLNQAQNDYRQVVNPLIRSQESLSMVIGDSVADCSDIEYKERRDLENSADFSASKIYERTVEKDDLIPNLVTLNHQDAI